MVAIDSERMDHWRIIGRTVMSNSQCSDSDGPALKTITTMSWSQPNQPHQGETIVQVVQK